MAESLRIFAAAAVLVCGGCGGDGPARQRVIATVMPVDESGLVNSDHMSEGVFIWFEPSFRQKLFATNFRDITVLDEVRDEAGEWVGRRHSRRADISVLHVASAGRDVLAFAGFAANDDVVVQRWTLVPVAAPAAAEPGRSPGGDAARDPAGTATGAEASPPSAPELVEKRFEVVEIYRGPLATGLRALEFDAEQRFLVLLAEDAATTTLYAFDNAAGAAPRVLADAKSLPALASMRYLQKFDHRTLGRTWVLDESLSVGARILFIDAANDGRFDGEPLVVDRAEWAATGQDDFELWDSLMGPRD